MNSTTRSQNPVRIERDVLKVLTKFSEEHNLNFRFSSSGYYDILYTNYLNKKIAIELDASFGNVGDSVGFHLSKSNKISADLSNNIIDKIYLIRATGWYDITNIMKKNDYSISPEGISFNLSSKCKIHTIEKTEDDSFHGPATMPGFGRTISLDKVNRKIRYILCKYNISSYIKPNSLDTSYPSEIISCFIALSQLLQNSKDHQNSFNSIIEFIDNTSFSNEGWLSVSDVDSCINTFKSIGNQNNSYSKICDMLHKELNSYLEKYINAEQKSVIYELNKSQFNLQDFLKSLTSGKLNELIFGLTNKQIANIIFYSFHQKKEDPKYLDVVKEEFYRFLDPSDRKIPYEAVGLIGPEDINRNFLICDKKAYSYIKIIKENFKHFKGEVFVACDFISEVALHLSNYNVSILEDKKLSSQSFPQITLAILNQNSNFRDNFLSWIYEDQNIDHVIVKYSYTALSRGVRNSWIIELSRENRVKEILQYKNYNDNISMIIDKKSQQHIDLLYRDPINTNPEGYKHKINVFDRVLKMGVFYNFWQINKEEVENKIIRIKSDDPRIKDLGMIPKRFQHYSLKYEKIKTKQRNDDNLIYFKEVWVEAESCRLNSKLFSEFFPNFKDSSEDYSKLVAHSTGVKILHLAKIYNVNEDRILEIVGVGKYKKGVSVSFEDLVKIDESLSFIDTDPLDRRWFKKLYAEGEYILFDKTKRNRNFLKYKSNTPFFVDNHIVIKTMNTLSSLSEITDDDLIDFLNSPFSYSQMSLLESERGYLSKHDIGLIRIPKSYSQEPTDLTVDDVRKGQKASEAYSEKIKMHNQIKKEIENQVKLETENRIKLEAENRVKNEQIKREIVKLEREKVEVKLQDQEEKLSLKIEELTKLQRNNERIENERIEKEVNKRIREFFKSEFHTYKDLVRDVCVETKHMIDKSIEEGKLTEQLLKNAKIKRDRADLIEGTIDDLYEFYQNLHEVNTYSLDKFLNHLADLLNYHNQEEKDIVISHTINEEILDIILDQGSYYIDITGPLSFFHSILFEELIKNSKKYAWPEKWKGKQREISLILSISEPEEFDAIRSDGKEFKFSFEEKISYVHLIYKDNGVGFKEENKENAFVPGERLEHANSVDIDGTGYGLSSIKKVVNKLNGKVKISKKPEKSEIVISLPIKSINN